MINDEVLTYELMHKLRRLLKIMVMFLPFYRGNLKINQNKTKKVLKFIVSVL